MLKKKSDIAGYFMMTIKTYVLLVLMVLGYSITAYGASPATIEGTNLTYSLEDGVLTISGTGEMPNYSASNLCPWNSDRYSITEVVIDTGVISVGNYAFYNCPYIKSVTIGDNVLYIGGRAFSGCSALKNVTIKGSVVSVGEYAFQSCSSLEEITLPNTITEIGISAFDGCEALKDINIPTGLTTISEGMFINCKALKELSIPDNVKYIDKKAFSGCFQSDDSVVKLSRNLQYISNDGNSFLILRAKASYSYSRSFTIRRYRDNAATGIYSGQLLYATPNDSSDTINYLYQWYQNYNVDAVKGPDTYVYPSHEYNLSYSKYGAAESGITTISCTAFYVDDNGKLVQAGSAPIVTLKAANRSDNPDPESSEISSSLGDLKVVMLAGENPRTLQELLGRAGLMHITCSATYILGVTTSDSSIVSVSGTGKAAKLTALSGTAGDTVTISYKYYADGCTFHGTQYSKSNPYEGKLTIEVIGASTAIDRDSDSLTINLSGLQNGNTTCTIEGVESQTVNVTNGTAEFTFNGLGENVNNNIFLVTSDGAQMTIVDGMAPGIRTKIVPEAKEPDITGITHGDDLTWTYGDEQLTDDDRTITVTAGTTDNGVLFYQWYRADSESGTGSLISGAGASQIVVPAGTNTKAGEYWYYCMVTNRLGESYTPKETQRVKVTVKKAGLTIIPVDNQSKMYSKADPTVYQYGVSGLKGNDKKEDVLQGNLSREAGEDMGTYPYNMGTLSSKSSNYEIVSLASEVFTITRIYVEFQWSDEALEYDGTQKGVTATVTNLMEGDALTISYVNDDTYKNLATDVGDYVARVADISAANDTTSIDNYAIDEGEPTAVHPWEITPKDIQVTPDSSIDKIYGDSDPVLTYHVEGLAGNDTPAVLRGSLSRDTGEDVGEYEIKKGSLNADNYTVNVTGGVMFEVKARDITVTARPQKVGVGGYISKDKAYARISSDRGLADGDTLGAVSFTSSSTKAVTDNGTITPKDAVIQKMSGTALEDVTDNYNISYKDGRLTVETGITAVTLCPVASPITVGESLASSSLEGGTASVMGVDVKGTFTWYYNSIKPKLSDSNSTQYMVLFTPDDIDNYTTAVCPVTLTVNPFATGENQDTPADKADNNKVQDQVKVQNNDKVQDSTDIPVNNTLKASISNPESSETGLAEQTYSLTPDEVRQNELIMNYGLKISQTGSKIKVKWGEVSVADGYDVFVAYCGKSFSKYPTVTINGNKNKTSIKKIAGKKIKLNRNFKLYVIAYKNVEDGKLVLGKTITGHVVGRKNIKSTNAKNIKVTKKKITLTNGKSTNIKAKTILVDKKKKQLSNAHAKEFRYDTSDSSVATVSKKGKVTAVGEGQCDIIVYSRNGYAKKVRITVK